MYIYKLFNYYIKKKFILFLENELIKIEILFFVEFLVWQFFFDIWEKRMVLNTRATSPQVSQLNNNFVQSSLTSSSSLQQYSNNINIYSIILKGFKS